MRTTVGASLVLIMALAAPAGAQQSASPVSVDSIRAALQRPQLRIVEPPLPPWVAPGERRLGIFTFVPPDTNGEIVNVRVPAGALVMRAARAVSSARYRRAERQANERVRRALQDFHARQPAP